MKRYYLACAIIVVIAVLAGVTNTLIARPHVADRIAAQDLHELDTAITSYHAKYDKLPSELKSLELSVNLSSRLSNYDYSVAPSNSPSIRPLGKNGVRLMPEPVSEEQTFSLCATFKTDTTKQQPTYNKYDMFTPDYHKTGHQCFTDSVTMSLPAPL